MPGVDGWIGTWAIYKLPRSPWDEPVRFGDTEMGDSEATVLAQARAIARVVAASL